MARLMALACLWMAASLGAPGQDSPPERPKRPGPNVVLIFIDDLGYGDIGVFGAQGYPTPNIDRLAEEGMRLTDACVPSAVCSASRAAILTGCYHRRIGISGALGPNSEIGIHDDEMTLAELCKQRGYATACFGKWHLGHHPRFLPTRHGFDRYYGLPYSNDMWPRHPDYVDLPKGAAQRKRGYPNLPLIEGEKVVDADVTALDQERLTTEYTERAVAFIAEHKEQPFFLYVPHSMVHVPLFVSDKFRGKSQRGLFGDVMMEVDWSVGQILAALEKHGLEDDTLVVFTGDNGPWLSYGDHAGSTGGLREGKGTMFEGGVREPTLARWPGHIPKKTECKELVSTMDIFPTVAALIGATLPKHAIDGKDIRPLLFGEKGARSPHEVLYGYYRSGQLQTVRDRRWKLCLPHSYATLGGQPGGSDGKPSPYMTKKTSMALFDLERDPREAVDVSGDHPDIVARLLRHAEAARETLGDSLSDREGSAVRAPGRLARGDDRLVW